ncbi:MAG: LysM peptidoglycan-binding domain-containing protein [Paenibacillaceae bacterium]
MKIHFVKAGETLYEIGKKYGVTVEEIVAANKSIIDPNLIMAGMKLIIPVKQMPAPVPAPIPADIIAPSIPHYPTQQNMTTHQNLPVNQNMPVIQNPTANQNMPTNQYSSHLPVYPGQAVPPFAAIPVPAQQVTAPVSMSSIPAWNMPTEYTAYNTPYHMTNYAAPNSYPNPTYQGMPQSNSHYQSYPTSMQQYPSNGNYEYYNTYSALQSNAAWPTHNPQPHAQLYQPQLTQDIDQPQSLMQLEDNNEGTNLQENKEARTSSTSSSSKGNGSMKPKKNTLHDQVMRLQQTRNRR